MPLEYQPFSQFLFECQALVAPEDLADNLETYYREQLGNTIADVQTLIPWVRSFNAALYTKAQVSEFCAMSVFEGPVGKITQVLAFAPGRDCRKYYYRRVSSDKIDCWIESQRCVQCTFDPLPVTIYDTPYCNYIIGGESACAPPYLTEEEDTCRFTSLSDNDRMFAVGPDYRIYAAPRFPCGYSLLVQWQGINRKWLDADLVLVDQQFREAVVNSVRKKIALAERDWLAARAYDEEYAVNLRTLQYRYHDEQDPELERDCSAALEQLMAAKFPAYTTPYLTP